VFTFQGAGTHDRFLDAADFGDGLASDFDPAYLKYLSQRLGRRKSAVLQETLSFGTVAEAFPELLCDKWHDRFGQEKRLAYDQVEHSQGRSLTLTAAQFGLGRFDVPVAVVAPEKLVEFFRIR